MEFVRSQVLMALIATLVLGVAVGAYFGYAAGARREAEKREGCQQLTLTLLTIQSRAQAGDRDPILAQEGIGSGDCFPPRE